MIDPQYDSVFNITERIVESADDLNDPREPVEHVTFSHTRSDDGSVVVELVDAYDLDGALVFSFCDDEGNNPLFTINTDSLDELRAVLIDPQSLRDEISVELCREYIGLHAIEPEVLHE